MSDLDKKVAQAMGLKSVNNCEQWRTAMTEEDDDTQVYKKPWVGLTDEEIDDAAHYCVKSGQSVNAAIRAIEAKLKEKNA